MPTINSFGTSDIFDISSVGTWDMNDSMDKRNIEQA